MQILARQAFVNWDQHHREVQVIDQFKAGIQDPELGEDDGFLKEEYPLLFEDAINGFET